MKDDLTLDALGLLCPLPVLKARKKLKTLDKGAVLTVLADDPAALQWLRQATKSIEA